LFYEWELFDFHGEVGHFLDQGVGDLGLGFVFFQEAFEVLLVVGVI
jgi:hypothetical protein